MCLSITRLTCERQMLEIEPAAFERVKCTKYKQKKNKKKTTKTSYTSGSSPAEIGGKPLE